ncbi:MAG: Dna2/Cas4 domain-containing protein [Haliscomenobacteraceae bacterium CHB4]|nr:Dna2/Cas4 domain-containing protein [Haliscomenobacteraceae bacterium CHB4]
MSTTATLIAYLHTCHRKLWLHANEIRMEHTSDLVAEGKLIGETSYERRSEKYTQVELDGIKIDFYDPKNKVVHETKRGRAIETAHRAQVQYYLYKLRQHGVAEASGLIEYPDLKKTEPVAALTEADVRTIEQWEQQVADIVARPACPPVIRAAICNNCSYYDLCYIGEES